MPLLTLNGKRFRIVSKTQKKSRGAKVKIKPRTPAREELTNLGLPLVFLCLNYVSSLPSVVETPVKRREFPTPSKRI